MSAIRVSPIAAPAAAQSSKNHHEKHDPDHPVR
jgi:hypothetical protein